MDLLVTKTEETGLVELSSLKASTFVREHLYLIHTQWSWIRRIISSGGPWSHRGKALSEEGTKLELDLQSPEHQR